MRNLFIATLLCFSFLLCGSIAFADPGSVPSGIAQVAAQVQAAPVISNGDFANDVISVIQGAKGSVPVGVKIAGLVLILLGLLKSSFMQPLWNKLGAFKAIAAPILGLALGLLLFLAGGPITLASVMAFLVSGAGAIILHQLLEMIKSISGIGPIYVSIINLIEGILLAPVPPAVIGTDQKASQ